MVRERRAITFGHAVERALDGHGDLLLHLLGRAAGIERDDHRLGVGDVGIGLDLELAEADQMPRPISPSESTIMTKRWCSAKRSSLAIMAVYWALQQHGAVHHDAVAGLEAGSTGSMSPARSPVFTSTGWKRPGAVSTHTTGLAVALTTAPTGTTGSVLMESVWRMVPYISGRSLPARVVHLGADLDGAGLRIHRVGDARHAPVEGLAGIGGQFHVDALAHLDEADRAFGHVATRPTRCSGRRWS